MSADEVGKKIASHCDGYDLIFTVRVTKKNAQKTALSLLKAMKGKASLGADKVRLFSFCFSPRGISSNSDLSGEEVSGNLALVPAMREMAWA